MYIVPLSYIIYKSSGIMLLNAREEHTKKHLTILFPTNISCYVDKKSFYLYFIEIMCYINSKRRSLGVRCHSWLYFYYDLQVNAPTLLIIHRPR